MAAAAGAITLSSSAFAACPASNRYTLNFPDFAAQQLDYATSYTVVVSNSRGQSETMGLAFSTFNLASNQVSGLTMPQIGTFINDGGTINNNLIVGGTFTGRTTNVATNSRVAVVRFTFATPIRDFTVQVNDVDFLANQFRDWIQINGINGGSTYDPTITTPHGNNNTPAGPKSAANSTLLLGATSSPLSLTVRQAGGLSSNPNNANGGTLTAEFAAPVTEVQVRYGNFPLSSGESITGQQAIGIQSVSFCPMPQLTVTKSSTPQSANAADPNRFNIPDADVVYAVTVSNSDTSSVDLNALILTDVLPPAITFRNSDFDDGGPVLTNFEFVPGTTGLSMAASDIAFSNNGGSSYGYAPAAGYDAAINAIRLNPKGQMAANSSFTVRFRARIK
jgi:uncharacterized repeat protein (TIGR01451 family)